MIKIGKNYATFLVLFLLVLTENIYSQVVVQAQIAQDKVGINQQFELEVSVSTSSQGNVSKPIPPELDGIQVLGTSQRTQISTRMQPGENGMEYITQKTQQYSFILQALKTGKITIGAFTVEVDGKVFKTAPIEIEVLKTSTVNPQNNMPQFRNRNRPNSAFDDEDDPFAQMDRMEEELFNQLLQRKGLQNPFNRNQNDPNLGLKQPGADKEPQFRSMPRNQDEAFFIQVEVDKTEVYEGEQIIVSWYLMTRGQLESLDRTKFPALKGFWKEIIEEVPAIQFYQEVLNGVPFKKALLARHALFPLKAGETVIDEFKIKSKVRLPQQGWGLNAKSYEYTKSSQRVNIKVKPLPVEGRPTTFTGAVGNFQIKANIEGSEPIAHQPIKLKIRYEGFGNAKGLELPAINWPEGLELFEVKSDAKFLKNGQSFKEFDVILIPRKEGPLIIPAIESGFFDPEKGQYYIEKTQEIPLQIKAGEMQNPENKLRMENTNQKSKNEIELVMPDVIPELNSFDRNESQLGIFWMAVYSLILLFFIVFSILTFGWGTKKKNYKAQLQKRIHLIDVNWAKRKSKDNYIEVTNLFYFVLGILAGEGGGSEEITKLLDKAPSSIRRQYEKEILELFDYFQTLSFAPEHVMADLEKNTNVKSQFEKVKKLLVSCVGAISISK